MYEHNEVGAEVRSRQTDEMEVGLECKRFVVARVPLGSRVAAPMPERRMSDRSLPRGYGQ